jgi:hypothetical protein
MTEHKHDYHVGDQVRYEGGGTPELVGTVTAVEEITTEIGPNQLLTIEWLPVASTREYAQDVDLVPPQPAELLDCGHYVWEHGPQGRCPA